MRIEKNMHGYYITKGKGTKSFYFAGIMNGAPVWVTDHAHSRDYKRKETAERMKERLSF